MSGDSLDLLIVKLQAELQDQLAAGGPATAAMTIDAWMVTNCQLYPKIDHVFRATASLNRQTLLMNVPGQNPVNIIGNAAPVNVQQGNDIVNAMVGGVEPTPNQDATPPRSPTHSYWSVIGTAVAFAVVVSLWYFEVPNWVKIPLSAAAVGMTIVPSWMAAKGYFSFRRKTWEKRSYLLLAGMLALDGIVRTLAAELVGRVARTADPDSWIVEAKLLIGNSDPPLIVAVKLTAVVALAYFALRAKDS